MRDEEVLFPSPLRDKQHLRSSSGNRSDIPFFLLFMLLGGGYLVLLLAMLVVESTYTSPFTVFNILTRPTIRSSFALTFSSSLIATMAAILVAVPCSYLLSRFRFTGRNFVLAILDIPQVLPPLVLGLCLLILFQVFPLQLLSKYVVYQVPAVLLAHFIVATACAEPILRSTFEQVDPRAESVALTLGCSRWQAFWQVTLTEARSGVVNAAAMAWARCFGCFGPLLVFAGVTRNKTEVLATTIYLELNVGDIEVAVATSLLMILSSSLVLITVRRTFPTSRVSSIQST